MPSTDSQAPWSPAQAPALARRLPEYVAGKRWFRSKSSAIRGVSILDALPLSPRSAIAILEVASDGRTDRYTLPLSVLSGAPAEQLAKAGSPLVIERLPDGALLCDALADPETLGLILERFREPSTVLGARSRLEFETSDQACAALSSRPVGGRASESGAPSQLFPPHPLGVEQSNSSIAYGQRFMLKLLRLLDAGESMELEMGRFLRQAGYRNTPRLEGSIRWTPRGGPPATLGILQALVPSDGGAWERTLERLGRLIAEHPEPPGDGAVEILAPHRERAEVLGLRTAELHLALGHPTGDPAFDPEPLTIEGQSQLAEAASTMLGGSLRILRERKAKGGHVSLPLWAGDVVSSLRAFGRTPVGGMLTRVHGDLHLGQILESGDDIVLIDFEGEPARPLAERRAKRSPLVDAAGVLRSFHYAATAAGKARGGNRWESAWLGAWQGVVSQAFRRAYFERMADSGLLPPDSEVCRRALRFFLLEKCLYELRYELDNRPDWVSVPMAGLKQLAEDEGSAAARAGL